MFRDRRQAGRRLGEALAHLRGSGVVVIALPRGGVVVGGEVARALRLPLDILIVRKIGAPSQPELAIGAVSNGRGIFRVLDRDTMAMVGVDEAEAEGLARAQIEEIHRRERVYRGEREPIALRGRTVIVVDDGIATGSTLMAGLRSLRDREVARIVVAVPCAPVQALDRIRELADEVVCLESPEPFRAVGLCYEDFDQVSDGEVVWILAEARGGWGEGEARAEGTA